MGAPSEQALCMHGLKHSAGYIQSKLADRLQTRFTPTIRFELDEGVKKSIEVSRLISEALAEGKPRPGAEEEVNPSQVSPADGPADPRST
jgi:ribosome-binding factor A